MPTSYAILDSGILLATVQSETYTQYAKSLIAHLAATGIQLAAPTLIHYELVSVVRKWVYRKLSTPNDAKFALDILLNYPVQTYSDHSLFRRAYELAEQYNFPSAYDSQYLALAERLACDFWTADERLFNTLNGQFAGIHWIGNWQSAP